MNKTIIVVLGSGRSGTSLAMQVLHGLGMAVSDNLNAASVANPLGTYEDAEIFKLQASLLVDLGVSPASPMPDGWLQEKACFQAIDALGKLIESRLEANANIFGFKDPKTSMLIPLWVRVFNKLKLSPVYILAVREPGATISSFLRQYNNPAPIAEITWLIRTVESLHGTASDCFILHYEDWFDRPLPMLRDLMRYTGLAENFSGNPEAVLNNTVKGNLKRAAADEYQVQNPYVLKLYEELKECRGDAFDRARLMAVVKECCQAMEWFKGWYMLAHQANKKLGDTQARLERVTAEAVKGKMQDARIRELENEKLQSGQLVAQVQKLQRQLDQFLALGAM